MGIRPVFPDLATNVVICIFSGQVWNHAEKVLALCLKGYSVIVMLNTTLTKIACWSLP